MGHCHGTLSWDTFVGHFRGELKASELRLRLKPVRMRIEPCMARSPGPKGPCRGPGPYRALLPIPFRIYPPPSDFTHHLQDLPTTFRIYPPPSEFTQHLQNLPTTFRIYLPPSEFTHHLHNLPTTFRTNRFWGRWTFLYLLWPFVWPQKRPFWQKWVFGKINKLNDHLHKLN